MKKYIFVFAFVSIFAVHESTAQILLFDSLMGKWQISELTNNNKMLKPQGNLHFQHDGIFAATGGYFGNVKGHYHTNENRSTVYIVIDDKTSEWEATVRNGSLRLQSSGNRKKPKIIMLLVPEMNPSKEDSQSSQ